MSKLYRPVGSKYIVYPVGAVYISVVNTNPTKWFGGTWEEIPGDYYFITTPHTQNTRGEGGSWYTENTTLTVDQIPSHTHNIYDGSHSSGDSYHIGFAGYYTSSGGSGFYRPQYNGATNQTGGILRNTYTGGGKGHNHKYQPPFYQIWAWKRTA